MSNISEIIQKLLDEKRMKKPEIAVRIGVSTRTIDYWLKGTKEPQPKNYDDLIQLLEGKKEPEPDYKGKVIQLQERLLNEKEKTTDQITAEIKGMNLKINGPLHSFQTLWAIEAKLNVLTDLILIYLSSADPKKALKFQKEMSEKTVKELRDLLDNYKESGVVDF